MIDYKKNIGIALRALRKTTPLTQSELALLAFDFDNTRAGRKAGQTLISKFECGLQEPTITEIYLILKVLHTNFDTFIHHAFKIHS